MQRRFTLIQGGLIKHWAGAAPPEVKRERGWRVDLRRPGTVDAPTFAAWRALVEAQPSPDPFTHPDYLLTAARHAGRGADIVLALAFALDAEGQEVLSGVVPLLMPHPVWGKTARLWQPAMAPCPIEPVFRDGAVAGAIEAVLRQLQTVDPRAEIRLTGVSATGRSMHELNAGGRLRIDARINALPVPPDRFVALRRPETVDWVEGVMDPSGIRDAVERFLLVDAERSRTPLLAEPATAAIARVVPRLFAHRGWARIELGWRGEDVVAAAIRLGPEESRVLWCSVGFDEERVLQRSADIDIRLAAGLGESDAARLKLVGS